VPPTHDASPAYSRPVGPRPPALSSPPGSRPEPRSTNRLAVGSLAAGVIGVVVLSVIFGLVALSQIRRTGESGRRLAIAGLVVSGVWVVVFGVAFAIGLGAGANRNAGGQITSDGSVSATSLQVGDCLGKLADASSVTSVPAVPCAQPHEGEVFAVFDLPAGNYPGLAAVKSQVKKECVDRLSGYAPSAAQNSSLGISSLYPFERNWKAGDREVVCVAASSPPATGSVRRQ
jgi:hypothetical protein